MFGNSEINKNGGGCLTKADLVDSIYTNLPIDKQKATQIIEDWIELLKEGLEQDSKVMLSGFGVFVVNSKHERIGRNPQTGDRITLAARKVVKFKPSQILKRQLNGEKISQSDLDREDHEMR
jgi:integration host factor subunit alpha